MSKQTAANVPDNWIEQLGFSKAFREEIENLLCLKACVEDAGEMEAFLLCVYAYAATTCKMYGDHYPLSDLLEPLRKLLDTPLLDLNALNVTPEDIVEHEYCKVRKHL